MICVYTDFGNFIHHWSQPVNLIDQIKKLRNLGNKSNLGLIIYRPHHLLK